MDRLTDRSREMPLPNSDNATFWARVHEELARYEDSGLSPEEVEATKTTLMGKSLAEIKELNGISLERMIELAKADAEGRLVVLPCKVGDKFYLVGKLCYLLPTWCDRGGKCSDCEDHKPFIAEYSVQTLSQAVAIINAVGKTIFFTREEAEKALERSINNDKP